MRVAGALFPLYSAPPLAATPLRPPSPLTPFFGSFRLTTLTRQFSDDAR